MELQVPPKITIGVHEYSIYFSEMVKNDGHDATVNHRLQEIYIDPDLPPSRKLLSLLHEILHIIYKVWKIDYSDDYEIDRVAEGIAVFLQHFDVEFKWELIPMK